MNAKNVKNKKKTKTRTRRRNKVKRTRKAAKQVHPKTKTGEFLY